MVAKDGADLVVSWVGQLAQDPCVLYRVYVATDVGRPDEFADFAYVATATQPSWRHPGAAGDGRGYHYLVTATSLPNGEGSLGHYGR